MAGIPPVVDTDAEDVAWALQTAEALWKRSERVDAIVWLRRAAQAAGEAEDDDRALVLARGAAELTEWLTQNPSGSAPRSAPPPSNAPTAAEAVDDLLRTSQADEYEVRVSELPAESIQIESVREDVAPLPPPLPPPRPAAPPPPPPPPAAAAELPPDEAPTQERASHVPSAAEKHAGMLDPWAEHEAPTKERPVDQESAPPVPPPQTFEPEEVVTSAPPIDKPRAAHGAKPPPVPGVQRAPQSTLRPDTEPSTPPTTGASGVDLSTVEALADLPEDAREAFARAAAVQQLGLQDEVAGFALALVLEGFVDLSATIADAPAVRLKAGEVLRSRGTIEHVTPIRLVAASDSARVATWNEHDVEEAFRTCPWVEDELRAAGDRFQAEVGITLGPLGERLDWGLRADIVSRLQLRALAEHEVYAVRGKPLPALVIVGAGELELLGDDDQPSGEALRSGDFLFPTEVLRAGPAPHTVRAAKGGALVLFVERRAAQEMLVTCPPLLEIFSTS